MSEPARNLSKDDAFAELSDLQTNGVIRLEGASTAQQVNLDGWDPVAGQAMDGNVGGVVIRYLPTGSRNPSLQPGGGNAPDRLDPRNALALVGLCQWLNSEFGVSELYHLGIAGGGNNADGTPRSDCHGQGRAVDFVGVTGSLPDSGGFVLTVLDDWGTADTQATPGGDWPAGTGANVSYRLDDPNADQFAAGFFRDLYGFIVSQWQDRTAGPDDGSTASSIGEGGFVMNPDHPTSAPGTKHGREAHRNHVHMQIGPTGTE
jgi:hypothetical protein